MYILGISSFYHDSAACLIFDGEIIAAAQEERFSRIKHDPSFPHRAIQYCINEANIPPSKIEKVIFYEKPFLKFERLIETYLAFAPKGFKSFASSMPLWIKEKLYQKYNLIKFLEDSLCANIDWSDRLLFSEHHLSHAASAFYPSPFESAAILTMDGVGEWATTSLAVGEKNELKIIKEIHFPHSLGLLYSAFTYFCGFKVNSGEYKLMGLAPYGNPKYIDLIKNKLVDIKDDGSFFLDMSYFDFCVGLTMTNKKFNKLFGGLPRDSDQEISQREMDMAASIQKVAEEIIVKLARNIAKETGHKNICLAGGVALNCVANGVLIREKIFDAVWIQPAAGDAGGALGAALVAWHIHYNKNRTNRIGFDDMKGSYLGPSYSNHEIKDCLTNLGAVFHKLEKEELIYSVAKALSQEEVGGWMQGRMEFGPRALGNRSIIADPRSSTMQKKINLKVKFRESFRPFAPSILRQYIGDWFDYDKDSPYMLIVANLIDAMRLQMTNEEQDLFGIEKLNISRSLVPAVTHIDYTSRVQTVHCDTNEMYHLLLTRFNEITGCPIIVNTSFNVRGEPIVCSPEDAFKCFMGTELDFLAIGDYFLLKSEQDNSLKNLYLQKYDLD